MIVRELVVIEERTIIGRGTVLIISMKENGFTESSLHCGNLVFYKGSIYQVTGIEMTRTLTTNPTVFDVVGLLVRKLGKQEGN